jgi:hypothetical protein
MYARNKESWYACCKEEKNLLPLLGIEPSLLSHPDYNPPLQLLCCVKTLLLALTVHRMTTPQPTDAKYGKQ